jgi:hypothetical protein
MTAKIIRPLDFQVTPEAFERSIEIHEHHGAFQEGPHPDYEDDDCPNCGGEGVYYDCIDGMCADAESGCDLCARKCDWCQP